MDDSNAQPRKVKLTPDQFTFDDEGQIVIDKEAIDEVLQKQSPAGHTPEAGGIGISIEVGLVTNS